MPRGAATGRIRVRFLSDISRSLAPSSTWRYQSWPSRHTKPIAATAVRPRTRRVHGSWRPRGAWVSCIPSPPEEPGAERLGRGQRDEAGGAEHAVVQRLGQDHLHEQRGQRRRVVEELEQGPAHHALADRHQDEGRYLDQRALAAPPAGGDAEAEADERLGERLHADEPAAGDVVEQPGE